MDPLFKAYGTRGHEDRDIFIRFVQERDIPEIAELFRANYGENYPFADVYDGTWVKRSIYSENMHCLVLDEGRGVLATGSVVLNLGDRNDRSGELARLVVAPDQTGRGLGKRVIKSLFKVAENSLEFAVGETRTAHAFSQEMFDRAHFAAIGFAPQLLFAKDRRECLVLYAKLHGNGEPLRSAAIPNVIPEVVPLAQFALKGMRLRTEVCEVADTETPAAIGDYLIRRLDRDAVAPLLRIPYGRLTAPLLFGNISLDQGFSAIRDQAQYLVAYDGEQNVVGAIGFRFDEFNRSATGIELIAANDGVWPSLCDAFVRAAGELGAEVLAVDASAYQPKLQRVLFNLGFRPAAYAPAMVFHGTERLDVVKMIKLNIPYDPGPMSLTEVANRVVRLVEPHFR